MNYVPRPHWALGIGLLRPVGGRSGRVQQVSLLKTVRGATILSSTRPRMLSSTVNFCPPAWPGIIAMWRPAEHTVLGRVSPTGAEARRAVHLSPTKRLALREAGGIHGRGERPRRLWGGYVRLLRLLQREDGLDPGARSLAGYSYGLALLALVGIPIILWAPEIGVVLTVMASISLAVVRAAQIFGEETIEGQ